MIKDWNYTLIWKTVKVIMVFFIFLFMLNNCNENTTNPVETQEDNFSESGVKFTISA